MNYSNDAYELVRNNTYMYQHKTKLAMTIEIVVITEKMIIVRSISSSVGVLSVTPKLYTRIKNHHKLKPSLRGGRTVEQMDVWMDGCTDGWTD